MTMFNPENFPYISAGLNLGEAGFRPYLPITLKYQQNIKNVTALLDTSATVNVMPYALGLELGYIWERQTASLSLTGNLANYEARVVVLQSQVGQFDSTQLVFAWTTATQVPLILGQVNFFMEFNVCFYRSQLYFTVSPKS